MKHIGEINCLTVRHDSYWPGEGRSDFEPSPEDPRRSRSAAVVQATRRPATGCRSSAEGPSRRFTAQVEAGAGPAVPGTCRASHRRGHRQPAQAVRVPAIREATLTTARRQDFRIIHLSIQRTHVHLIVEAKNKTALARGMQGFQISAAKHLNAAMGARAVSPDGRAHGARRRGTVFPDRYHAEIISSPRQARNALAYVMCNFRKHEEDRAQPMASWTIDWFSTAAMFPGWAEYGDTPFLWRGPEMYDPLVVYQPRTWLLREGWKLHGPISCHEVPSTKRH